MGQHTKIDWCDASWNPVTGCYHKCQYCYARRIAKRFSGENKAMTFYGGEPFISICRYNLHELDERAVSGEEKKEPYPFGFEPTLHRYRLDEPQQWETPRNIFVCSMADLFGEWVPDQWIEQVFDACRKAPQHRYLFLTKNPARLLRLGCAGKLPADDNYWYGTTCTKKMMPYFYSEGHNTFLSVEPILESFGIFEGMGVNWVIIGAETGNRIGKVIPEREWIDKMVSECDKQEIPVFMKESLREMMGSGFRQEYPWKE